MIGRAKWNRTSNFPAYFPRGGEVNGGSSNRGNFQKVPRFVLNITRRFGECRKN